MKKVLLVIALVLIIALPLSAANYAKTNGLGVGVNLGFPFNGAAVKYGMDDFRAIGTLGWNFTNSSLDVEVGAQYDVYEFEIGELPFYVNAGVTANVGLFGAKDSFTLAVAVPVGLSYFFEEMPIEAFFKLAPALLVVPGVDWGGINASIGGLWYLE
jgi:predicted small secreted protein